MTVGSDLYQFGPFRLDPEAGILYRGAEPTMLGRRAVALLRRLLENPGAPVSKDALVEAGWGGLAVADNNLTVQIAALRRVLAEVRRDQGDVDEALAEVRRALRGNPGDLSSRLLEAQLLIFQREYEAAYQALVPLSAEQPTHQRLLALLAQAAQLSGRGEDAARYREQLQSLQDRD